MGQLLNGNINRKIINNGHLENGIKITVNTHQLYTKGMLNQYWLLVIN